MNTQTRGPRQVMALMALSVGIVTSIATSSYAEWSFCGMSSPPALSVEAGEISETIVFVDYSVVPEEEGPGEYDLDLRIDLEVVSFTGEPLLDFNLVSEGEVVDEFSWDTSSESDILMLHTPTRHTGSTCEEGCSVDYTVVVIEESGEGSVVIDWSVTASTYDTDAGPDNAATGTIDVTVEGGTPASCPDDEG